MNRLWFLAGLWLASTCVQAQDIRILYAEQKLARPPTLSGLHPVPDDLGLQGALRAIVENNQVTKITGQNFVIDQVIAKVGESLVEKIRPALKDHDLVVINALAQDVLAVADLPESKSAILFNIAAADDTLRDDQCRNNMLHILPATNMLTDALAQFFVKKQWQKWSLISGAKPNDKAFALDLEKSALKFGITIVAKKEFAADADLRESAADEVPLLTQDAAHDAVVVADMNDDFGSQIAYNTYYPRPVAGTHGLVPSMWSEVVEPWGAIQLQNAFAKQAGRGMRDVDFAAYLATRLIGEAATRTKATDAATLRKFMLAPDFQMQAYKGRGVSFREWNGQLRQPIHLLTKETQVAIAPVDGFLHEGNELDTLGPDRQETKCRNFKP